MLTKLMPAARVKVLGFLLLNAAEEVHVREIARRAGVPLQAAQRELALLEEIDLIKRLRRGRQVFVSVQTSHPLFEDLLSLLLKSDGLAVPLQQALEEIDGVEAAAVYGSVAAGSDTGRSDIDLLIVGSPDELALHEAVSALEEDLGRPINYTLLTRKELTTRIREDDPFFTRVLSGDLIQVIGEIRGDSEERHDVRGRNQTVDQAIGPPSNVLH
jgi:predicted nucleotidyltransferase